MANSSALSIWTCDSGQIRVTSNGQPSVFDMIKTLGGKKNPRDCWASIVECHPEVVGKTDNFRFPGPGQRETPVAKTKEDVLYILGLLPGTAGRSYREQAAKLFTAFLDNPSSVAAAAIERMTEDEQERLEARLKGKRTRHTFTDALKTYDVVQQGYAHCTNAIYVPILGSDARQLKNKIAEEKNLVLKSVNPRDHFTVQQLTDVETAERVAVGQLERNTVGGNPGVERIVRKSAEYVRKILDGDIDIPGIV
tara:strand:- start:320 stop:1075 length:756 start_codon:yes stop_codon:yes gene_type:complete